MGLPILPTDPAESDSPPTAARQRHGVSQLSLAATPWPGLLKHDLPLLRAEPRPLPPAGHARAHLAAWESWPRRTPWREACHLSPSSWEPGTLLHLRSSAVPCGLSALSHNRALYFGMPPFLDPPPSSLRQLINLTSRNLCIEKAVKVRFPFSTKRQAGRYQRGGWISLGKFSSHHDKDKPPITIMIAVPKLFTLKNTRWIHSDIFSTQWVFLNAEKVHNHICSKVTSQHLNLWFIVDPTKRSLYNN